MEMGKLPEIVKQLYREERWPELVWYFRSLWDKSAWLTLKRNKNAVERIRQEFTRLTGRQPFAAGSGEKYWNEQIAKYVQRLGVAALIRDLQEAVPKYKPKSLVYFLSGNNGLASRWEMLLMKKLSEDIVQQKQQDDDAYKLLGELINLPVLKTRPVEPEWVVGARKNLAIYRKQLENITSGPDYIRLHREIKRIVSNLKNSGFPVEKEGDNGSEKRKRRMA